MLRILKRFWQYLALLAGIALIAFEILRPGGVRPEGWFWLIVGALIVALATVEIVQRWKGKDVPPVTDATEDERD